jgi:hypothetical protein
VKPPPETLSLAVQWCLNQLLDEHDVDEYVEGCWKSSHEQVVRCSRAGDPIGGNLTQGPTLFAGLSKRLDLKLVSRLEFGSGAVAMRYEPGKVAVGRQVHGP